MALNHYILADHSARAFGKCRTRLPTIFIWLKFLGKWTFADSGEQMRGYGGVKRPIV